MTRLREIWTTLFGRRGSHAARDIPRRHGRADHWSLAGMPIAAGRGLDGVACKAMGLVEPSATALRFRPRLLDGREGGPALLDSSRLLESTEPIRRDPGRPEPGWEWTGSELRVQTPLPSNSEVMGFGLFPGPLSRRGRLIDFWNTDAFRYGEESRALYQCHPLAFIVHADGTALGIIADSFARGHAQVAVDGIEWVFEGEPFDLWVLRAASPQSLQRALAELVGRMPLPPRWTLGYHQCRWGYASSTEMLELAAEFRRRELPCDGLWLDIEHHEGRRSFSFDPRRFPDPKGLIAALHAQGFHVVAIEDPGIVLDDRDAVSRAGLAGDHAVLLPDGSPALGQAWPGLCWFPDFTREATREFWSERIAAVARLGIDGIWNDMNEPSVMRTTSGTLDDAAIHRGMGGGPHRRFHNLYGLLCARASAEGLSLARPAARPFVLSRSNALGGQRHAAAWTGDNQATWTDLAWSIPMVLNLALSGQPFSGPDLPGYDGNPDEELFVRWFSLGAWLPFFRGHSEISAARKEPWAMGRRAEGLVREVIRGRMRLLPHLYTLFEAAESTGLSPILPLTFADSGDPELVGVDDQFLLGEDLIVAPVVHRGQRRRRVRVPRGRWYVFPGGGSPILGPRVVDLEAPLGAVPVLARGGSILVMGEGGENAEAAARSALVVHVFLDERGRARGRHFEDAGDGFGRLSGHDLRLELEMDAESDPPRIVARSAGRFRVGTRRMEVRVHGLPGRNSPFRRRADECWPFPLVGL